ncbi:hypothetical protein LJ737_17695 [Hymenobacter sp. 15J16-1T3B]|uniref:hypothetical protein n=1 Tax=Hymenobacter sp. 15J16-1T3B TaxID=2886941 RepID=UPI001D0F8D48|nr:hypothetical protein [Hymenobacter sp. 15J16-1T3B]MCC3159081.1 hypothetical protein [Hymenobacter sp. 15J16-1T3B]
MMRRLASLAAGLLAGLALVACENTSEAPAESGKDYYPLKVGAERVFDVVDRSYTNNRPTEVRSQVREQLTETYRDAAGALTYKLVRSSRATASAAWRVDSVQTLTVNAQNLLLTRSNWRTVELIFPVREGGEWNKNAFNDRDTLVAVNRRYQDVGAGFVAGTRSYDNTLTTFDDDPNRNNIYYEYTTRQVYAKGVGPVLRESLALNYCQGTGGTACQIGEKYIVSGKTHTETLVQ